MFERRLRAFLTVFALAALVILGRLTHLQIVHGNYYHQRALDALELPPTPLPFIRGSILERGGEVLVSDEPAWDLTIDFPIIALQFEPTDAAYKREWRRWRKKLYGQAAGEPVAVMEQLLGQMWSDFTTFCRHCGRDPRSIMTRAREIYDDIKSLRQTVAAGRGFDAPVAEESAVHAILKELSGQEQIAAREWLGQYPWVHIDASSYRRFADDTISFAHILGRMGPVDAETVEEDPRAEDPFARYQGGEQRGISGVEWAAEATLRGRRGHIVKDREGNVIEEITAENGYSVRMTIVGKLQRRLFELLGDAVKSHAHSNAGAIVVLDVETREALAVVSYPSFDPSRYRQDFEALRDNTTELPLLFRAVGTGYQPGSTVKPLACLAGLFNAVITPQSQEECRGALFPEQPDKWRCWQIHGSESRMAHGYINTEQALTGSCNVFMYRLGERLGVERLTGAFDMCGIGRPSGTGLREDEAGINPTPSWLMRNRNTTATGGAARLFAIGQAELSMTPVQVANMMATYASGKYRPVTLLMGGEPSPQWILPGSAEDWSAIRRGIFGVVNDPQGTAYKYAHFQHPDYALCGKTGSATAAARPTAYRIPYLDEYHVEREEIIAECGKDAAIQRFRAAYPLATVDVKKVQVAGRWPDAPPAEGEQHAHAWFGGYLQKLDSHGHPNWRQTPTVAFAVLVEFGGSGGRTSGPLGREVARVLVEVLGPDLDLHRKEPGL